MAKADFELVYLCEEKNNPIMQYRIEKDTMGEVNVPIDAYYGAQTQRSIDNFKIAQDINKMPKEIIRAFAYLKHAAAITNNEAGILTKKKADLIGKVCKEILEGKLDEYFPLVVWQTGSGTQSNMNVNEVVAYRGHVLNGGKLADKKNTFIQMMMLTKAKAAMILFQQQCILQPTKF